MVQVDMEIWNYKEVKKFIEKFGFKKAIEEVRRGVFKKSYVERVLENIKEVKYD